MTEDNNAFSQFGARSAKFDELLKKYQTIDEGDTVAAPPLRKPEPEAEPQPEIEAETQTEEITVPQDEVQTETVEDTEQIDGTTAEEPETKEAEPEEDGFSFDEQSAASEEPEEKAEPEPDYSYDINIFSSGEAKNVPDIDSFDDSWLDSALDESLFYKPEAVAAEEFAEPEAALPNPEPETEEESEYTDGSEAFVEPEKDMMAGGYIAPTDFSDFEFDPESGMDFGTEDAEQSEAEAVPVKSKKKPLKDKKKPSREKKESGKNEMSSITGFSKNYKASEGKGSKKDGFFVSNFVPRKSDTVTDKIRKIIMIVCILVFLGAGLYLLNDFVIQPITISSQMNKLEEMVGENSVVADKAALNEKYPDVEFPEGMLEKYADLYAKNPDFVGWINIEGIDISLPVVQGEDNKEYLKRDFNGKHSKYGSVFMNCANDVDRLNYNTSLFGHHMLDSKMFGNLIQYKDVETYKKAPVIEFNTIYGDYKWKIFAVFITNGTAEGDDGYLFNYLFTDLSTSEKVETFLGEIDQRAIYKPEVDIAVSDKILTLSTCSYEFDEARLVVMARMVRPGESEQVSGRVITNVNPRYPAAYYEAEGIENPYASAYKWQPS
ncbi:MAG: class B sortase [Clostridia bacterium]|nr:class B sortase [Clostridia bacterium]